MPKVGGIETESTKEWLPEGGDGREIRSRSHDGERSSSEEELEETKSDAE